jgi:putative membrane protein insertion efficiency factor
VNGLLSIPKFIVLALLRFYKSFISPLLPPACRFEPTCSIYTTEAVDRHGVIKGIFMGAIRILKCQPFHPGGFDPVPETWRYRDMCRCHRHHPDDSTDTAA